MRARQGWAVAAAALAALAIAGCGGDPAEENVEAKGVPVSITRTGGIAGVEQTIDIKPDGAWVYLDRRTNSTEQGELSPDQRDNLFTLTAEPKLSDELTAAPADPQGCADAFNYAMKVGDVEGTFADCGDDRPEVKSVIAAITEATPF